MGDEGFRPTVHRTDLDVAQDFIVAWRWAGTGPILGSSVLHKDGETIALLHAAKGSWSAGKTGAGLHVSSSTLQSADHFVANL